MLKSDYFSPKDRQSFDVGMPLANIGQKLQSAREAQGLSLTQVYERTKIPINHLQSIEVGNAEDLPETVYVSGFIKRYAECIGLDGQILSDEYRRHLEEHRGKKKGKSQPATPIYASADYVSKSAKGKMSTPMHKLWLFNGLIIVGVLGTITWFINTQTNNIANQPDPSLISLKESTTRLAPNNLPAGSQPNQPLNQEKAPVPTDEKLTLSATRHVWVEVKKASTGENAYNGFMEQGDRRDFEDSQGLIVRAGDGGGLSVERQGKIESFGLSGKITERTFSAPVQADASGDKSPATTSGGLASGALSTQAKPQKRTVVRRSSTSGSEGSSRGYRRIEDGPSRQYMPGESLGGTRNIDVPYRYSEGRLDAD